MKGYVYEGRTYFPVLKVIINHIKQTFAQNLPKESVADEINNLKNILKDIIQNQYYSFRLKDDIVNDFYITTEGCEIILMISYKYIDKVCGTTLSTDNNIDKFLNSIINNSNF
jgi:hypothetical protein